MAFVAVETAAVGDNLQTFISRQEGFSLKENIQNAMRGIPSMDRMLSMPLIKKYEAEIGRDSVKFVISGVLDDQRAKILKNPDTAFDIERIEAEAEKRLKQTVCC